MEKPKFKPPTKPETRLFKSSDGKVRLRPLERKYPKIGRNQPCPCNSMRKFKHCHGANVKVEPVQPPEKVDPKRWAEAGDSIRN